MTFLADSPNGFLTAPPQWSLAGAVLQCADGQQATLSQTPFRWVEGFWESETVVSRGESNGNESTRVVLRISPETLRRWKEVAIDPFIEACAQLEEHLRRPSRRGHLSALTLL